MSRKWTMKDVEKTGLNHSAGSVTETKESVTKTSASVIKIPKSEPVALSDIKMKLKLLQVPFETEFRFHPTRKFRFDIAIVEHKIAIEYEGIISEKSRHTGIDGFTNDCRKYNLAQAFGWKVLRYTAKNYKECFSELKKIITDL